MNSIVQMYNKYFIIYSMLCLVIDIHSQHWTDLLTNPIKTLLHHVFPDYLGFLQVYPPSLLTAVRKLGAILLTLDDLDTYFSIPLVRYTF